MGSPPNGYYPCVVTGGADRIFGFDSGRPSPPGPGGGMVEDLAAFCSRCGFFRINCSADLEGHPLMTETWAKAYEEYRQNPRPLRPSAEDGGSRASRRREPSGFSVIVAVLLPPAHEFEPAKTDARMRMASQRSR